MSKPTLLREVEKDASMLHLYLSGVGCNALFIYLIILLENIVYYYILYGFWRLCDVFVML